MYHVVETHYERERETEVSFLPSMSTYCRVKFWGRVESSRSEFVGEIGKRGSLVVEHLDDVADRLGCKLRLMCRAGCLPVCSGVIWGLGPQLTTVCHTYWVNPRRYMIHLFLCCPAHVHYRLNLLRSVSGAFSLGNITDGESMMDLTDHRKMDVLLGSRLDSKVTVTENVIDVFVNRYLKKDWKS